MLDYWAGGVIRETPDSTWTMVSSVNVLLHYMKCSPFNPVLDLQPGAKGFHLSNPPVLESSCLLASLHVFEQTSMSQLTRKSRLLTGYLELLLEACLGASRRTGQDVEGEWSHLHCVYFP